jgi:hypothetical protein
MWIAKGKPAGYWSQWVNTEVEWLVLTIAGGVIGVLYGAAIWGFELIARRRIRPVSMLLTISCACLIQAIASYVTAGSVPPQLTPQLAAVSAGLILSIWSSEKIETLPAVIHSM